MTKSDNAQITVTPNAEGLLATAGKAAKKGPAPVHLWNPPFCGDLDMVIKRDGTWFYQGTPIGRPAMVRLFSSILKREGDDYFLVTPVEKVGITVEDAPFVATDVAVSGSGPSQTLRFTTHVGDTVDAGPDNLIRVAFADDGEPSPYVHVRAGLDALIDRKTFYRLVDMAVIEDHDTQPFLGIWSGGVFQRISPAEDLV